MLGDDLRQADRLADRIRLHRQLDPRPTVVVEGTTDERFVDRVIPREASLFSAGTRDEVIRAARDISAVGLDRVACVLDRDFDDALAAAESDATLPLVPYDDADLEAMLWWTPILEDIVAEVGSREKLIRFGGIDTLRETSLATVQPLQRLRRASALHQWGLAFDRLDLRRRINAKTLTLGTQSLCDALWHADLGIGKNDLYEAASDFPEAVCPTTGRQLVRGRDAIAVVGVALRRRVGNLSYAGAEAERIAEIMRLRASDGDLAGTAWRTRLRGILGL